MNAETTLDLFPEADWGDYSEELAVKRTFIEAVLPVIDDSTNKYTFLHGLYTEDFRTALFEEEFRIILMLFSDLGSNKEYFGE